MSYFISVFSCSSDEGRYTSPVPERIVRAIPGDGPSKCELALVGRIRLVKP